MKAAASTDAYIRTFPAEIQKLLQTVRATIRRAAPRTTEVISYGIPAFRGEGGVAVYFAAFNKHLSLFPTSSGTAAFQNELTAYRWSKGAIQFPFDAPLPLDLIARIAKFRADEVAQARPRVRKKVTVKNGKKAKPTVKRKKKAPAKKRKSRRSAAP